MDQLSDGGLAEIGSAVSIDEKSAGSALSAAMPKRLRASSATRSALDADKDCLAVDEVMGLLGKMFKKQMAPVREGLQ